MSVIAAFEEFMKTNFESAVDSSTKASWSGSGYSVELFDNGSFRVLWDNEIGNLYDSPGVILGIPTLGDDEWDEDPSIRFYDNAVQAMRDSFEEHRKANLGVQHYLAFGNQSIEGNQSCS